MYNPRGISFVEMVIVMVVLTLVASVIVPQFSQAASEAKADKLTRILHDVRSFITIYKAQHNNMLPGTGKCNLVESLCSMTDVNGDPEEMFSDGKNEMILGPYMDEMPANPYNGLASVDIDGDLGDGSHGWHYNSLTGMFRADSSLPQSQF